MKQKTEWQGQINKSRIISFNIPLSIIDRIRRQEFNKNIKDSSNTIDQLYLINIHRPLHSTAAEDTSLPNIHGTFTKIDHILSH